MPHSKKKLTFIADMSARCNKYI